MSYPEPKTERINVSLLVYSINKEPTNEQIREIEDNLDKRVGQYFQDKTYIPGYESITSKHDANKKIIMGFVPPGILLRYVSMPDDKGRYQFIDIFHFPNTTAFVIKQEITDFLLAK